MYNKAKMIGELNMCLFKLRDPLIDFLAKTLPPTFLDGKWENYIFEELKQKEYTRKILSRYNFKSFRDFDISILLEVLLMCFSDLREFYNSLEKQEYFPYLGRFNDKSLTKKVKDFRNIISHPNDSSVNIEVMKNILNEFLEFGKFIDASKETLHTIEVILSKYKKYQNNTVEERKIVERISFIEDKVIRPALNYEGLADDIEVSVLTTLFRLKNKKLSSEIDDFFISVLKIPRGQKVKEELNRHGFLAFEDIREEYEKRFLNTNCKETTKY
jgi:hypothetical protein